MENYEIRLGIDLDDKQLNSVKTTINNLVEKDRKIMLDIDFNIKNANRLAEVGKEISKIEEQLKGLNNIGSVGKGKSLVPVDTKSLENSIDKIHDSIKKLQNAFGKVDKNKGVQSLLTTVNKISKALDKVSGQFESLNKNLMNLTNKDFSFNFDFGSSNNKSPEQLRKELNLLEQEAKEYEKYFKNIFSKINHNGSDPISLLMNQYGDSKSRTSFIQLQNTISSSGQSVNQIKNKIAAYKEYIDLIKRVASSGKISLESVEFKLAESGEITRMKNEANETKKQLQELFSGGIDADKLHQSLGNIENDLRALKESLSGVFSESKNPIDQLTKSFDRLSGALNNFTDKAKLVQDVLENTTSNNNVGDNLSKQAQQSQESANTVVQNEERKQHAFQETANEARKLDNISIDISDGNVNDLKNALKNLKVDDTSIENATKELSEMGIVAKSVSGTLKDGNLTKFEIKGIQQTEDGLKRIVTITRSLGADGWSSTKKYSQALDEVAIAAEKVSRKLNSGEKGNTNFDVEISGVETKFKALGIQSEELEKKIESLKQELSNMYDASKKGDLQGLIDANERYEKVLQDVENQLKLNKQAEQRDSNDNSLSIEKENALLRLKNLFGDNSEAARMFSKEVERLQREIDECGNIDGLRDLKREIVNLGLKVKESGVKTQTFGQNIKKQFSQYSSYFSVASLFMYAEQGLRSMFEQVKSIDSAMTELKKVTDETDATYNKFLSDTASRASEIGTTIDGLVQSTSDFARLGYNFADAQGLAEVANIYAVVGDEVEGVEGATESLISTMAAFKDEANGLSNTDFATGIVDKFNEIGNKFAISSGGIGEAMKRSASSLDAANNSIDESIALITAANTVVQNPEKVGNAFKTISMRIRGAKTELEEAGESTEGMAESTATMRREIMALSGVDIMLNENEFKSTYQIMDELSNKWEDLSDIAQASIIELMAGKHQGNVFASLMDNFETARKALDISINSSGSAMKEHEKWQKSLEAQLLKLKAAWQGLSQAFLSSNFLKGALNFVIKLVEWITKLVDSIGVIPTLFAGFSLFKYGKKGLASLFGIEPSTSSLIYDIADAMGILGDNAGKSAGLLGKAGKSLKGFIAESGGAGSALKNVGSSLIGLVSAHPYIAAATVAVGALTTAFAYQKVQAEKLAKEVDKTISSYKEQHSALKDLQSDYDTSNEDSMISKYKELSKGVDGLGRNVSLTADEYSEYQGIVNTIAEQIPSLISGYDSQGNAILSCKGNIEELTEAYEKLIHAQNREIITNSGNIEKNFENTYKKMNGDHWWSEGHGFWAGVADAFLLDNVFGNYELKGDTVKNLQTLLGDDESKKDSAYDDLKLDRFSSAEIRTALKNANIDVKLWDDPLEVLKETLKTDPSKVKGFVDDYYEQFAEIVETQKTSARAILSEAFDISSAISGLDYGNISEEMKAVANQVVNSLDYNFFEELSESGKTVEQWTKEMLNQLNSISESDNKSIEAAFDLQTKFNGGDISYGEYVQGLLDVDDIIRNLDLNKETKKQLKISLGLDDDGIVKQYINLRNRLIDHTNYDFDPHIDNAAAQEFLNSLSADELSVAIDVIAKLSKNDTEETIQDIRDAINREMAVRGLTFDLNLEAEITGLESLNTALAESVSATGLTSESIDILNSRYAELESEGYNLSAMFEETSNGIHLNKKAVNELEQAYIKQKKTDIDEKLGNLQKEYDLLTQDIENCNDASERASLYVQRDAIIQQINDAATLSAQYEGLASSYNAWLSAEEAGQERDMYENVIEGFKNIEDEISRGWLDDGTIKFLELMTGETNLASKSASDLKKIWKELDNNIKNTSYSVKDFFTVDEDGNSTSAGIYNFLKTVDQLEDDKFNGTDIVKRDKNGKIISFDFNVVGGDKAIAEALGISEELVQIMLRAADDAGFVINLDGAYTQLADLKTEAETARDLLISLKKDGLDKLADTDVDFNLNAGGNELVAEQERAVKLLDKFKKDGKIDLSIEGAKEALDIAEYLTIALDDATEPRYMQIDASSVKEEIQEPLEKMQEFERLAKNKHLFALTNDVENLEKVNEEMGNIAEYLEGLDKDTKKEIGIDVSWDENQIAEKLEKGEIELDAELNLDVQMSDDLKDMRLMMMNQLGLVSDNEVKLKIGYDIDDSVVDSLTDEQKEVVVKFLAEDKDIQNYTPEQKEALVKYIADGGNLDGFTPEEKEAFVNYLVDGGSVDGYTPEDKKALAKYLVDGGDPANYEPPSKTQQISQDLDTSPADNYEPPSKTMTIWATIKKKASDLWKWVTGSGESGSGVNGTANVNGTTGRAFKQGSWGTKNSGTALVGELGAETLVRDGHYYTIGNSGAEFIKYKKGDIIFNHRQTEELFKNGRVTSGNGRAKALVSGTAFSDGTTGIEPEVTSYTVNKDPKSKKKSSKSSSGSAEEFKETIDWIEVAISRIEREIDNLDQKASNVYESWSSRNSALTSQISEVGSEIELQQKAYDRYMQEANSVGLSEEYASKVRDGTIDIETITDEALKEKITDYQTWYEKALKCKDEVERLREEESKLYKQRFDNVSAQYDGILGVVEHEKNMLEEYINQSEAQAWLVSGEYYNALANNERGNIDHLEKQKASMLAELQNAMESGTIVKGSESW